MKNLNIMIYVAEMSKTISKKIEEIGRCASVESAKTRMTYAVGLVDSLVTMSNIMVCTENNDITDMLGELEDNFMFDIYQAMVSLAASLDDEEALKKYAKLRDEYPLP